MQCLELKIPPLPQILTIGKATANPSFKHFRRCFEAYNIVFVKSGALYLTENETAYEISKNIMLILEPGKTHWGHFPCQEQTEMYWIHLTHPRPTRLLDQGQVRWSYILQKNGDNDEYPINQYLYLPKYAIVDLTSISPMLDRMIQLYNACSATDALRLNTMLFEVLIKIQSFLQGSGRSRSAYLSEQIIDYLQRHANVPLHYKNMEDSLHFHFDYLSRCLKKHTGMTPLQYLRTIQMNQAKSLLENTELPITKIGEQIGMDGPGYFNRVFRQLTGMTPSQYRKNQWKP